MSVLLLSGGVDSLVLLARECAEGRPPLCVSFAYGQRHFREMNAAANIADRYGVERVRVDLPGDLLTGSALTGGVMVPLGLHYTDPRQSVTVVPNRNLLFLSCAAALAAKRHLGRVLFACHAGDAAVYPDCRPEFVVVAARCMRLACGVGVEAPFLGMTKKDVVRLGRELSAPLEMAWSCYLGESEPCGKCGACVERAEAMA